MGANLVIDHEAGQLTSKHTAYGDENLARPTQIAHGLKKQAPHNNSYEAQNSMVREDPNVVRVHTCECRCDGGDVHPLILVQERGALAVAKDLLPQNDAYPTSDSSAAESPRQDCKRPIMIVHTVKHETKHNSDSELSNVQSMEQRCARQSRSMREHDHHRNEEQANSDGERSLEAVRLELMLFLLVIDLASTL